MSQPDFARVSNNFSTPPRAHWIAAFCVIALMLGVSRTGSTTQVTMANQSPPSPSPAYSNHAPPPLTRLQQTVDDKRSTTHHYSEHNDPIKHLVFLPSDRRYLLTSSTPAEERPSKPSAGWPAVIFVHGAGEVGTSLEFLRTAVGATGALPQLAALTAAEAQAQPADDPYRWVIAERSLRGYVVVAPLSDHGWGSEDECQAVLSLVRSLPAAYSVDPNRVFITGVSMGGFGVLRMAAMAPTLFAGVVPLCGYGREEWCATYSSAQLPMLFAHGVNDQIVPFKASIAMVEACKAAKVKDVTLWKLDPSADPLDAPGTGHAAWRNVYSDARFWSWLESHARTPPA